MTDNDPNIWREVFGPLGQVIAFFGGLGGMAPSRRGDIARLGMRSIVGGSLASFMTGCIAGLLL